MKTKLTNKEADYLDINYKEFSFPICIDHTFVGWLKDSNFNERKLDLKFTPEGKRMYVLTYSNMPI